MNGNTMSISMRTALRSRLPIARLLRIDALLCSMVGLLLIAAAAPISDALGLSTTLVRGVGILLLPWAMFVFMSAVPALTKTCSRIVIAGNVAWVAATLALAVANTGRATQLGTAALIVQAVAVAVLTAAQYRARSQHWR